jgi:hypothetical protein
MTQINNSRLKDLVTRATGPAPWYWKTFPVLNARSGQRFVWTHQGEQGPLGYVVTLNLEQQPDKPRLALNTYCCPFLAPPDKLGIWCPEGKNLRFVCFDPDQLQAFDFAEIAGWFKSSSERIYSATAPIADFEVPHLPAGTHKIEVPPELQTVDELIVPMSYTAQTPDDPASALCIFYLQAGLVEVIPQKWFTSAQYDIGYQWIIRAVRDPESHRIAGSAFRIGTFLLDEDNSRLDQWLEKTGP